MAGLHRLWDGGHWTSHSLKGLGPQKRLVDCNVEEVAAEARSKGSRPLQFGEADRRNKDLARQMIVSLFGPENFPQHIKVLSMPGTSWFFEADLLRAREDMRHFKKAEAPVRTEIHACENDRVVYYDAIMRAPGVRNKYNVIKDLGKSEIAERSLGYFLIKSFLFANVEDVMRSDEQFDCVWLDYFGPLSLERISLIKKFAHNNVRGALVVTSLKARWNSQISEQILNKGGYEKWVREEFSDFAFEHYLEYIDTSPMAQFAVRLS